MAVAREAEQLKKRGAKSIRLMIHSDGTMGAIPMEASARDDALNRAARGAITGLGQFGALPPIHEQCERSDAGDELD